MSKIHYKKDSLLTVMEDGSITISDEVRKEIEQKWNSADIRNDFIFCKVMQDKDLLRELLRRVLPELDVAEFEVEQQKSIEIGMDIHGVRFDIYATLADGTAVDIEMQMLDTGYLPKRMRYYGSLVDVQMLEKGVSYSEIRDLYIIMICPFDLFDQGRHVYTFKNRCIESTDLELRDGVTTIVLNASGILDDISDELKVFLDYVSGKKVDDEYVMKLDAAVTKAKMNKRWRAEYMIASAWIMDHEIIGRQKGIEEEQQERISTMLRNGKTPQEIADFCGYSIDLINKVQDNMFIIS